MNVRYFCHECMPKAGETPQMSEFIEVTVRSRSEGEDIRRYVEDVARIVGIHHSHRGCKAKTCDLMIPADNEKGLGYPR